MKIRNFTHIGKTPFVFVLYYRSRPPVSTKFDDNLDLPTDRILSMPPSNTV